MTDDQKARAVQEALAGVRMCPQCDLSMRRGRLRYLPPENTEPFLGWCCFHCDLYMLEDGTVVERVSKKLASGTVSHL